MSSTVTRRRFVEITPIAGLALLAACGKKEEAPPPPPPAAPPPAAPAAPAYPPPGSAAAARAADAGPVAEGDPQAVALGYVSDASKVDKAKHANYVDGSMCGSCALYQGKAGDATGPCPIFGGKAVSAKGWCTSYAKKA